MAEQSLGRRGAGSDGRNVARPSSSRWEITTFDVDGAVTRLRQAARSDRSSLPHLRSTGLMLVRRDRQADMKKMQKPWEIGKSFEDAAPCSAIMPAAKSGYLSKGQIKLVVNDKTRQDSDLSDMIWSVAQIIAELSKQAEIAAGDLIYTGTPEGVGPVIRGDRMVGTIDGLQTLVVEIV